MSIIKKINFEKILAQLTVILFLLLTLLSCSKDKEELVKKSFNAKSPHNFLGAIFKLNLDSLSENHKIDSLQGEANVYSNKTFHVNYFKWCSFYSENDSIKLQGRVFTPKDSTSKFFLWEKFLICLPLDTRLKLKEVNFVDNQYFFRYMKPYRDGIYTFHLLIHNNSLKKYYYVEKSGEFVDVPENGLKINEVNTDEIRFDPEKATIISKERIYFPTTGGISYIIFESKEKVDFKTKYRIDTTFTDEYSKKNILSWFFKVDSSLFNEQYLSKIHIDSIQYRYHPQFGDFDKRFEASWLFQDKISNRFFYGQCDYYVSERESVNHLIYNVLDKK